MDVIITRKLAAPFQPELGIGAIAPEDVIILNIEAIKFLGVSREEMEEIINAKQWNVQEDKAV